jgi:hypothetical protein
MACQFQEKESGQIWNRSPLVAARIWDVLVLPTPVEGASGSRETVAVSKQWTAKFGARAALSKYEGNRACWDSECI